MPAFQPATIDDVQSVECAIAMLKRARNHLASARAPQSLNRVRAALKSAEGALRHVDRRVVLTDRAAKRHAPRPLRCDEAIVPGMRFVNQAIELDTDEGGRDRTTRPGTVGHVTSVADKGHPGSVNTSWNLFYRENGAWVCPTGAELRDPAKYLVLAP